jgi:hypothetical protein
VPVSSGRSSQAGAVDKENAGEPFHRLENNILPVVHLVPRFYLDGGRNVICE